MNRLVPGPIEHLLAFAWVLAAGVLAGTCAGAALASLVKGRLTQRPTDRAQP